MRQSFAGPTDHGRRYDLRVLTSLPVTSATAKNLGMLALMPRTGSSSVNSVFRVDGKGRFHHQEMPVVGFESFTVEQFVGTWAADELS